MPMSQFHQAMAYMSIEPDDAGDNRRTAALMAQIANFAGKSLKEGKHMTVDDYLGTSKPKRQTAAEQIAFMRGLGNGG